MNKRKEEISKKIIELGSRYCDHHNIKYNIVDSENYYTFIKIFSNNYITDEINDVLYKIYIDRSISKGTIDFLEEIHHGLNDTRYK